ncbi:MAG: hypothetical protein CMG26_00985, partial [Candidatus Marinimicrobia bacterium]|nr:hypothetical protein [Candidatus Neomarinimicrobiota bacterium]
MQINFYIKSILGFILSCILFSGQDFSIDSPRLNQFYCSEDTDLCLQLDGNELKYVSTKDISSFQFSHSGCINGVFGGDASENNFFLTVNSTTVMGVAFGNVIPAGSGTLINIESDAQLEMDCILDFSALDSNNISMVVDWGTEDGCFGLDVCLDLQENNLNYVSNSYISTFQISHDGCIDNAFGGDATANDFSLTTSSNSVFGISFSSLIPPGAGTLFVIQPGMNFSQDCFGTFAFSDSNGSNLNVGWSAASSGSGCTDLNACNYDENAFFDDGSCLYEIDCFGECGGVAVTDCLGVCGGDAEFDCQNICDGSSYLDSCGICDADPTNDDLCLTDCDGCLNGSAYIDECGNCVGGTTSDENYNCGSTPCQENWAQDCNGICNGLAYQDECGVCDEDPTNDCIQDCNGDWGGTAYINSCGICVDGNTNLENINENGYEFGMDCLGICSGDSYFDDCGICDDDTSNDNLSCS